LTNKKGVKMPTEKQINYALFLLDKNGYSTKFMNASYKNLGATRKECSGLVIDWLKNLTSVRISNLISDLK